MTRTRISLNKRGRLRRAVTSGHLRRTLNKNRRMVHLTPHKAQFFDDNNDEDDKLFLWYG